MPEWLVDEMARRASEAASKAQQDDSEWRAVMARWAR